MSGHETRSNRCDAQCRDLHENKISKHDHDAVLFHVEVEILARCQHQAHGVHALVHGNMSQQLAISSCIMLYPYHRSQSIAHPHGVCKSQCPVGWFYHLRCRRKRFAKETYCCTHLLYDQSNLSM